MTMTSNTNNTVLLKGNLARDAETITTTAGGSLTKFRMATNREFVNQKGKVVKKTSYPDIQLWRALGDATEGLKKGDYIELTGNLVANEKSEAKDGKVYYNNYIDAETILTIIPKSETQEEAA